ncbi:MAG: hypothetical protein OXF45_05165, partial [Candidatus Dadabacteria bacterium]|nr:hypothetical protein [Candidatus Dadabacteria bacterium]
MSEETFVLSLSQLSGINTSIPRLNHSQIRNGKMSLIIGDSFEDRLYFWNCRHFFSDTFVQFPAMRIPQNKILDQQFIASFGKFLQSWQYKFPRKEGCLSIDVRSYSIENKDIQQFTTQIKQHTKGIIIDADFNKSIPTPSQLDNTWQLYYLNTSKSDRIREIPFEITPEEPDHFDFIQPHLRYLKKGDYNADIKIDRHNDHSPAINASHSWILPKRQGCLTPFVQGGSRTTSQGLISV